jgi:hypothetical protein
MNAKQYYGVLVLFVLIYLGISFTTPIDQETLDRFSITPLQLRLLSLVFIVPLTLIWTAAFYGFIQTATYVQKIKKDADGRAFLHIANGLMVLAMSLPISTILSSTMRYIASIDSQFVTVGALVNRYTTILFSLVAFYLLRKGAKKLQAVAHVKQYSSSYLIPLVISIALGCVYIFVMVRDPDSETIHHVPVSVAIATVILPYVFVWFLGLRAAQLLYAYQQHVAGELYQQALRFLAFGVFFVIVSSVLFQGLSYITSAFENAALLPLIGIVYLLLGTIALGYVLIARGASKLKKIEEVI